jgi:thiol:disulfide interchange protein DsbC
VLDMKTRGNAWWALVAAVGAAVCGPAVSAVSNTANTLNTVKTTIHERFPDLKIEDVRPSPLPGFYEVFTGTQVVYSNSTADYIFVGKLIDTHTKKDLAHEELQTRLTIDFQKLPLEKAIKIVKGTGARRLALFEDPDCPYCKKLEQELANVNDVTLYVFLFPFVELHPQAKVHAHAIWCAPDRASAWTQWMLEQKDPGAPECTDDPIDGLQAVGAKLNIAATPTFFLESGRRVEGTLAAAQLEQLLTPDSKAAAATTSPPSGPQS